MVFCSSRSYLIVHLHEFNILSHLFMHIHMQILHTYMYVEERMLIQVHKRVNLHMAALRVFKGHSHTFILHVFIKFTYCKYIILVTAIAHAKAQTSKLRHLRY